MGPFELLEGRNEEYPNSPYLEIYIVFLLSFFFFFRATPMAYGGSQARDPVGAVAAGPAPQPQPTPDPSRVCDLHHGSRQRWILPTERGQGSNPCPHGY